MTDLNQATLQWLYNYAGQGIFTTDAELTIRAWNHWLEMCSGRSTAEMIGRNLLQAYPELITRQLDQVYDRALAGQAVVLAQRFHRYLLPMPPAGSDSGFANMQQTAKIGPLMEAGGVVGTITVIVDVTDRAAREAELRQLFETEQRRRQAAAALLDITQVAGSSLELKHVLKEIAQLAAGACQANRCSIFLLDDAGEYLQPVMSQFANGHADLGLWQTFKTTTAVRVDAVPLFRAAIRERRPALLDDPARTDLMPRQGTEPFGTQKLLVVPLICHDRAIGLMALDHTDASREFTPEQIDLALTIGGQVAASIENAQLYARTQQLAITDSLTGLYNRRGLFELGRREVDRARRFGRPLAAVMFDLDHFKRVNDTYGHATGDQVLVGLAERCRPELRDVDLLGRYGGEEFAVLLPETDLEDAGAVAERLRQCIAQAPIDTDQGAMEITISLGVAPLDDECEDLEALLERADQALYAAKRAGRNQVCRF